MTDVLNNQAPAAPEDPLGRLSGSARGWHTIQMAVLGFIGICGVLRTTGGSVPGWVQWLAGVLAAAALLFACAAVFMVGRVAYPVEAGADVGAADLARGGARLRSGIRLTVIALILIVIAALSGWWPKSTAAGTAAGTASGTASGTAAVTVSDNTGRSWCGTLVDGTAGTVSVNTADGTVTVRVSTLAQVRPVAACP
jgi:hypothetical protein